MEEKKPKTHVSFSHIRESNLIEGFDDPELDKECMRIWFTLKKRLRVRPITHGDINWLNYELTKHQPELDDMWRGTYRNRSHTRVWINGKEGMNPALVGKAMDDWLERFYTADPIAHHIEFEHIHPFIDGNGRTGRMLMWVMQQNRGEKTSIIYKSKAKEYYDWF